MPRIDDLTYLGIAVALVAGVYIALAARSGSSRAQTLRNRLIVAAVAVYAVNILNARGHNDWGLLPSISRVAHPRSSYPDYIQTGVNPSSVHGFAIDALLLLAAGALGIALGATARGIADRGKTSPSNP